MGHKGVSVRKPKKSRPVSNNNLGSFSNTRNGDSPSVHSLVKDSTAIHDMNGVNHSTGPGDKHKKES